MAMTEAATVPVMARAPRRRRSPRRRARPAPGRKLAHAFEQVLGQAAALEDHAHEGEERDREQQVVRHDAEHPIGSACRNSRSAGPRSPITPKERPRAESEGDRKPISMNRISPTNIAGAARPYSEHQRVPAAVIALCQLIAAALVVDGLDTDPAQGRDALDELGRPLQQDEAEA